MPFGRGSGLCGRCRNIVSGLFSGLGLSTSRGGLDGFGSAVDGRNGLCHRHRGLIHTCRGVGGRVRACRGGLNFLADSSGGNDDLIARVGHGIRGLGTSLRLVLGGVRIVSRSVGGRWGRLCRGEIWHGYIELFFQIGMGD